MQCIERAGNWVIEGCYADLLGAAAPHCTELIFLNPGLAACVAHCRTRLWEPHKYETHAAQEAQLPRLIAWVWQYEAREDACSLAAHPGRQAEYRTTAEAARRARGERPRRRLARPIGGHDVSVAGQRHHTLQGVST